MNQFKMVAPMNKHFKGNKISYIFFSFLKLEEFGTRWRVIFTLIFFLSRNIAFIDQKEKEYCFLT